MLKGEFYLLIRKFFIRSNLWIILPIIALFLSWMLSAVGASTFAPDVSKGFKFLVFLFAPGCYLAVVLGRVMRLRLDEVLVLDVVISGAVAMFVSVYLSFSFLQISEAEMVGGLFVVTVLSGLLLLPQLLKPDKLREKVTLSRASKAVIGLLASFFVGFLLTMMVIPESFWRGWDPWLNTPVAGTILEEGLNPFELKDRYIGVANVGISGFYYFIAAIQGFTGISFYLISRFGGPVLAGMASMITYLVVRRLEGVRPGLLASFLLFLNPFFVTRFSMALRENLGFIFFLGILFLLIVRGWGFHRDWASRLCFSFILGLFLAVSLSSHSLVPIIVYGVVVLEMVFLYFKTERVHVELVLALFLSFLLSAPYLLLSMVTYVWTIRNLSSLSPESFFFVFTVATALGAFILFFYSRRKMFRLPEKLARKVLFIMSAASFLGAVYSIVFPKNFPILGSYNPPITLDMFALSSLLLACLGFMTVFRSSVPIGIISLSLLLILIPNLTNVNIAFPLFRLVIYISWVVSYGAAKLLGFIYDIDGKVRPKFLKSFRFFRKTFEIGNSRSSIMVCIMLLTLGSLIMLQDFQATWKGYSNYIEEDIESALNFTSILEDDDVVVPQERTHELLLYVGIDMSKMISNKTILQELYSANTLQSFSRIIQSSYPRASKVYVFILRRFIELEHLSYPSEQFLKSVGVRHQLGSVVYYTVSLSYSEKELLESSIQVQLPAGPQWVRINITGTDLSMVES